MEIVARLLKNAYLCQCNEDAMATVGCGSVKSMRACLRVHLALQL